MVRKKLCDREAQRLRDQLSISEPPVDVRRMAAALLIPLRPVSPWTWRGRALLRTSPLEIAYNPDESPQGIRFSIGHEIGHFVLHPDTEAFSIHEDELRHEYAEDPRKEMEREAEYFASTLLVPAAWLKKDVRRGQSPEQLAQRYDVSTQVMFIALSDYRLLNLVKPKGSV